MSFFKDNSKFFVTGALGILAGAGLYLLFARRNSSNETVLAPAPIGDKPATDAKTLHQMLLQKLASQQKTDDLLKEVAKSIYGYIWQRTKSIDRDIQTDAFQNFKKVDFNAYINQLIKDLEISREQNANLQREVDDLLNDLGLSTEQVSKVSEQIGAFQKEENANLKQYIPLAKEYFEAKVKVASKEGRGLTKKLKEFNWTEQNSHFIIDIVKLVFDAETFTSNNSYLAQNLQLEMTIQSYEEQFKKQKQDWDRLLEPIYLELPFKPAFINFA